MIVDQLFTPKPLEEGGPYDLPGIDYPRSGDTPPKRRSAPSDYPYSKEQDDDYFREIFRKKREAAKKAAQDKEQGVAEEQVYESFYKVGRMLVERKMSEKEILDVFAQAEQGMTNKDTGANRTMLGRGKDVTGKAVTSVKDSINKVLDSIQNSAPVAGVDVAYDQATDALANAVGQDSKVMDSIKKYRLLAKEYPKTQLFVKTALIALAGLATGGAALPVIAGLTAAVDSAIKGEKLSSLIGKGAGAGLMGLGAQEVSSMLSSPTGAETLDPTAVGTNSQGNQLTPQQQLDAGVDKFEIDAALDWVNADPAGRAEIEKILQLTPDEIQKIADSNLPRLGGTGPSDVGALADPTSTTGMGAEGGMAGQFAGGQYTIQQGDQLGYLAQANGVSVEDLKGLNPQIDFAKPLQPGMNLNLPPQGDGAGSVYQGYTGSYGDKVTGAATGAPADAAVAIDYTKPGPESTDSLGQKLEYGVPVNDQGSFVPPNPSLPAAELAKQTAAYNSWLADFMKRFPNATLGADGVMQGLKPGLAPMSNYTPGMDTGGLTPKAVQESVRFKILPAEQLIDQKLTVLTWALNESVNRKGDTIHLTTQGVYTVFENVDRYRRAIVEYTQPGREQIPDILRPDAYGAPVQQTAQPGMIGRGLNALDRFTSRVGSGLSNFGRQFTTGVTKEKLKMNWGQAGKPTDSDQLAAWLVTQKVPQQVVSDVYGKMGIPYTAPAVQPTNQADSPTAAPASTGTAQRLMPFNNINPKTGQRWTVDDMEARRAERNAPAATNTAAAGGPGFNAGNIFKQPGMEKYAKKTATPPAKTPNFAGTTGYGKTTTSFKQPGTTPAPTTAKLPAGGGAGVKAAGGLDKKTLDYINAINAKQPESMAEAKQIKRITNALTKPVAEMLQMVETKEDVQRIKKFIDDTFVKHGAVNESAFAVRNKIIEHVTQTGAQRRREHARKSYQTQP